MLVCSLSKTAMVLRKIVCKVFSDAKTYDLNQDQN